MLRANLDLNRKRIELVQGDLGGGGVNGFLNGSVDFSSGEPRLAVGLAITPMSSGYGEEDLAGVYRHQGAQLGQREFGKR